MSLAANAKKCDRSLSETLCSSSSFRNVSLTSAVGCSVWSTASRRSRLSAITRSWSYTSGARRSNASGSPCAHCSNQPVISPESVRSSITLAEILPNTWGRMSSCGGLPTRPVGAQVSNLPHLLAIAGREIRKYRQAVRETVGHNQIRAKQTDPGRSLAHGDLRRGFEESVSESQQYRDGVRARVGDHQILLTVAIQVGRQEKGSLAGRP